MSEILRVEHLKKQFGGIVAVDDVSFSIQERKIIGLIGPNGSGKSTLFNIIAGIYPPDSGEVYFKGERITSLPPHEIFKRGIVKSFQIPSLFYTMTVFENFMIPPREQIGEKLINAPFQFRWAAQEMKFANDAINLLKFLKLNNLSSDSATNLSGGQMKLCEIGRGVMGSPSLMLLDEPAAGVAPYLAKEIFGMILNLRDDKGITFFIIEHRLEIFLEYVDYIYVMNLGKIVFEGPPKEVIESPLVKEIYLGGGK